MTNQIRLTNKTIWEPLDLERFLLPYVQVDYLSLTPRFETNKYALINELKKFKKNLKVIDLTNREKSVSQEDSKLKSLIFSYQESKYEENSKYDFIFYSYRQRDFEKLYLRVPGDFSNGVLRAFFTKQLDFSDFFDSLSRIDFKIQIPNFVYTNFESDFLVFKDFCDIQFPNCKVILEPAKGFSICYRGEQTSRRLIRTSLSKKRCVKTFEIECKRESAKMYTKFVKNNDIFSVNKTLILECIESFSEIEDSIYTKPLLTWSIEYLEKIPRNFFPGETFSKRKKREGVLLSELLNKKTFHINNNLVNSLDLSTNDTCLRFMVLVFFSKLLLDKWKENVGSFSEIKLLMHQDYWDKDSIENQTFLKTSQYSIKFKVKDLLSFLNFTPNELNRRKVLNQVANLMDLKYQTWVGDDLYRIQYVHQFMVTHKKGLPIEGSLILHPFVVFSLIKDAILLHEKFLKDYYKILTKLHLNKTKKNSSYGFYTFFSVYLSFTLENSKFLTNYFLNRKKTNLKSLSKQIELTYETIKLASNHLKKDMGIKVDNVEEIPVSFIVLERVLNSKSDKVLRHSEFFFQPRFSALNLNKE